MQRTILASMLLLAGCSAEQAPFQPGQWEFKIDVSAEGQRVFWGGGGQCIDAAKVANLPVEILGNSAFGSCKSSGASFAGGKLDVSASCDGKAAATTMPPSKLSLQGNYTPTSFESRISGQLEGETPVKAMSGMLSARRTGDCPTSQQGNGS